MSGPGSLFVEDHAQVQAAMRIGVHGSMQVDSGAIVNASASIEGGAVVVRGAGSLFTGGMNGFGGASLRFEDGAIFRGRISIRGGSVVATGAGSELRAQCNFPCTGDVLALREGSTARIETGALLRGQPFLLAADSRLEIAGGAAVVGDATPVPGQLRLGRDARLRAKGTIVADVVGEGASIEPGTDVPSIGTLTIDGNLTLGPRTALDPSRLVIQFDTTASGIVHDRLDVSGHVDLADAVFSASVLGVVEELDGVVRPDDVFVLIDAADTVEVSLQLFTGVPIASGDLVRILQSVSGPKPARYFRVFFGEGSPYGADRLVLTGYTNVPEPETLVLVGAGVALLSRRRRR
jgi:hypothetical protein